MAPASTLPIDHRVADVRERVASLRARGRRVCLVPTMGALHDGHLSLIRTGAADDHAVIVSVFVNPTQFGPGEDFERYPRNLDGDAAAVSGAGAEAVFAPAVGEVYPDGFATTISVGGPSEGLEGAARPGHFDGVATVVAKLLLMVRPDRAVFGQKDAQQVAVIRRLVADLHLDDIELVIAPTLREADGLAMSSRNAYLQGEDRRAAAVISLALGAMRDAARAGEPDAAALVALGRRMLDAEPRCAAEYVAIVDPDTFAPRMSLDGPAIACIAARVGPARLIDNLFLTTSAGVTPRQHDEDAETRALATTTMEG